MSRARRSAPSAPRPAPPKAPAGPGKVESAARGGAPIEVPRVLPRGRHKLDPQLVAASQRARLLEAVNELVAEKGYVAVTISDIVTRAGIAKRTFYEHFPDKMQCFLTALDATTRALIEESNRFFRLTGSIQARCDAAMRGFLALLAARPNTARVLYLEAVAAGPEGAERWIVLHEMFANNIIRLSREAQAIRPEARVLSETHALAVVGALHGLIYRSIKTHGPERLLELADELVPLAVAFLMARPAPAGNAPKASAGPRSEAPPGGGRPGAKAGGAPVTAAPAGAKAGSASVTAASAGAKAGGARRGGGNGGPRRPAGGKLAKRAGA
jgi:AcrR family transcriptional regulator